MAEWQSLSSSNVSAVKYESDRQVLSVRFTSGSTYEYDGVPEDVYTGLTNAASAGGYIHSDIKDVYPARRVG